MELSPNQIINAIHKIRDFLNFARKPLKINRLLDLTNDNTNSVLDTTKS